MMKILLWIIFSDKTQEDFDKLFLEKTPNEIGRAELQEFVNNYFLPSGSELISCTPSDFNVGVCDYNCYCLIIPGELAHILCIFPPNKLNIQRVILSSMYECVGPMQYLFSLKMLLRLWQKQQQ